MSLLLKTIFISVVQRFPLPTMEAAETAAKRDPLLVAPEQDKFGILGARKVAGEGTGGVGVEKISTLKTKTILKGKTTLTLPIPLKYSYPLTPLKLQALFPPNPISNNHLPIIIHRHLLTTRLPHTTPPALSIPPSELSTQCCQSGTF